jgi:hypothetical protein
MKRLLLVFSVIVGAWMFSPTPEAQAWGWYGSYDSSKDCGTTTVPELDPSSAGSAMILLLGGMALIASRRRKEDLV